jgi:hypothetical protein
MLKEKYLDKHARKSRSDKTSTAMHVIQIDSQGLTKRAKDLDLAR